MSAYPLVEFAAESTAVASDNSVVDIAGDGTPKIRRLWSAQSYQLTLITHMITSAEKATLETFYANNLATAVEVTILSDSYSLYFTAPPTFTYIGGTYWTATSQLTGTKVVV